MSPSGIALLGYVTWTFVLIIITAVLRTTLTMRGEREANQFSPTGEDVSPFAQRLARAHANCFENLPMFAALVLLAMASGHGAITDGLAIWVLVARVGQSTVHLVSTSPQAVTVRFGFYIVQLVIQLGWVRQLFFA